MREQHSVKKAIDMAVERFDSLPEVCAILDVSNAYIYRSMKDNEIGLPCALKLEYLLDNEVRWQDLAPVKIVEEIVNVKDRIR